MPHQNSPPKKKLTQYIEKGADLVIFSGGKFIAGPNNSGILMGRKDLIKLAHLQAYPFHGVGRAAKMSRETIVGLVTALKIYMKQDEKAIFKTWERKAHWIVEQLDIIPGLEAGICYQRTVEEGEPMVPLCCLKIDEEVLGITGKKLVDMLREGDPSIEVPYEPSFLLEDYRGKITVNPEYMLEGDEKIVVQRIKDLLTAA
jgi:Selenocysteine synthase [seryl-tRNASer selenium transferase]